MAIVAAVFAIYGIVAMFAGMPQFALVMGAVIELGKIVGISWLYRNWGEPTKIKFAMLPIVTLSILLTSLGIFGLLSKAHLEQTSPVANNGIQIERLDQQIAREQARIIDSETVVTQLDQSVQALINFDRIRGPDGALAVREGQAEQRELLRQTIDTAQAEMDRLEDQKLELSQQLRAIELEVGPVKYLAELVYGDGTDRTEEAVRWVIIAFIFVFDPMAILLLMAANYTLVKRKKQELVHAPLVEEPTLILEDPENTDEVLNVTEDTNNIINAKDIHKPVITAEVGAPNSNEKPEIGAESGYLERTDDLQEVIIRADEQYIAPIPPEGTIDPNTIAPEQPASVDDDAQVIAESAIKKTLIITKDIITDGVTPLHDIGNGYIEYNNHLFEKNALKEIKPDLFTIRPDSVMPHSSFGTQFPNIAKKKDIFVRVDTLPNRVFRFDGNKWIELNKNLTATYLYDQEYIKYLVEKIDGGEYDVELLSEQERCQIEEYLNNQNS